MRLRLAVLLLLACGCTPEPQPKADVLTMQELMARASAKKAVPAPAKSGALDPSKLLDGDLIFQRSQSSQSLAVSLATRSPWTHMGIVYVRDGAPFVYEAIGPVKLTPLKEWVGRGDKGHAVVKRLREPPSADALVKMKAAGATFDGKPYDLRFEWSDGAIYCSELVFKIYEAAGIEIGRKQPAKDFDLSSPEVQRKIRERFGPGAKLNPEEPVVSPQSMFEDPDLVTVFEN